MNGKCHGWGRSSWSSLPSVDVVLASTSVMNSEGSSKRAGIFFSSMSHFALFSSQLESLDVIDDDSEFCVSGEIYEGEFSEGARDGQVLLP